MLSSITPVGEHSRSQRWTVTVVAFTLGSLLGGAATGVVLGGLGVLLAIPVTVGATGLAILALVAVVGDLAGVTPPSLRRQVDRAWMTTYRGWVYGLGYGVQLGSGVTTYISSWTTYAWLVSLVLVDDVGTAVLLGMVHGGIRAATLWTTARLTTPARIRDHHARLQDWAPTVRRGGHLLLTMAAVAALAGVATG